jgi:electron transport complex protein RnfE
MPMPILYENNISILTLAPGGFFVFGCMIALVNKLSKGKAIKKKEFGCAACPSAAACGNKCCENTETGGKDA